MPVAHGDSFVIECDRGDQHGVVVVDGGPKSSGAALEAKLKEVGTPDLLVLTHYDDDHIKGLLEYVKSCQGTKTLPAKEVWANCVGYVSMKDDAPKATEYIEEINLEEQPGWDQSADQDTKIILEKPTDLGKPVLKKTSKMIKKAAEMTEKVSARVVKAPLKEAAAPVSADQVLNWATPRSALQGMTLARALQIFINENNLVMRDDLTEGVTQEFPFATIEVVSPTDEWRTKAIGKQEEEAAKHPEEAMLKTMRAAKPRENAINVSLEDLAKKVPSLPSGSGDIPNASSIAFILRCDGLSILMLGDSFPQPVEAFLRSQGYSEEHPLEVDYVKVAHHGSQHNTSNELLDIIKCNNYLISTSGAQFYHPDRESIAHILCHPRRDPAEKVHLYFNYDLETLVTKGKKKFLNEGEEEKYNFEIHECANEIAGAEVPEVSEVQVDTNMADVARKKPADMPPYQGIIDTEILDMLTAAAKESPRLRMNLDLRNTPEDLSQRMLNAIEPGSVLPVHRHLKSSETVVCLRGCLREIFYDADGKQVIASYDLAPGTRNVGLNIPLGQWHTVESLESGTVILEVKDGPYEPLAEDETMA